MSQLSLMFPVTTKQLKAATRTDPVLRKVLHYMETGWPKQSEPQICPYWFWRFELTVEGGMFVMGSTSYYTTKAAESTIEQLHRDHPGISQMKSVARSYLWWPGTEPLNTQLLWLYYSYGYGQFSHGNEFIWTLLGPFKVQCF